eukprot:TRINITY_DN61574_c0_g2_i1.p1 TRINITY_DN61574_c0_g2~~TRINITY_DN61574_c0_g2_i1.p1  ORF type:complete len:1487 (-),score=301.15 TRINITY_DN61574_c0_g2_i1:120-4580(-)
MAANGADRPTGGATLGPKTGPAGHGRAAPPDRPETLQELTEKVLSAATEGRERHRALVRIWQAHHTVIQRVSPASLQAAAEAGDGVLQNLLKLPSHLEAIQRAEGHLAEICKRLPKVLGAQSATLDDVDGLPRCLAQIWIYLADLNRYRAAQAETPAAQSKALQIAQRLYWQAVLKFPHNGHAFNQLGLLACSRGERLTGVHCFYRALLCAFPFDSLASLRQRLAEIGRASLSSDGEEDEDEEVMHMEPPVTPREFCEQAFCRLHILLLECCAPAEIASLMEETGAFFLDCLRNASVAAREGMSTWSVQLLLVTVCAVLHHAGLTRDKPRLAVPRLLELGPLVTREQLLNSAESLGAWRLLRRLGAALTAAIEGPDSALWAPLALFTHICRHLPIWHDPGEMGALQERLRRLLQHCALSAKTDPSVERFALQVQLPEDDELYGVLHVPTCFPPEMFYGEQSGIVVASLPPPAASAHAAATMLSVARRARVALHLASAERIAASELIAARHAMDAAKTASLHAAGQAVAAPPQQGQPVPRFHSPPPHQRYPSPHQHRYTSPPPQPSMYQHTGPHGHAPHGHAVPGPPAAHFRGSAGYAQDGYHQRGLSPPRNQQHSVHNHHHGETGRSSRVSFADQPQYAEPAPPPPPPRRRSPVGRGRGAGVPLQHQAAAGPDSFSRASIDLRSHGEPRQGAGPLPRRTELDMLDVGAERPTRREASLGRGPQRPVEAQTAQGAGIAKTINGASARGGVHTTRSGGRPAASRQDPAVSSGDDDCDGLGSGTPIREWGPPKRQVQPLPPSRSELSAWPGLQSSVSSSASVRTSSAKRSSSATATAPRSAPTPVPFMSERPLHMQNLRQSTSAAAIGPGSAAMRAAPREERQGSSRPPPAAAAASGAALERGLPPEPTPMLSLSMFPRPGEESSRPEPRAESAPPPKDDTGKPLLSFTKVRPSKRQRKRGKELSAAAAAKMLGIEMQFTAPDLPSSLSEPKASTPNSKKPEAPSKNSAGKRAVSANVKSSSAPAERMGRGVAARAASVDTKVRQEAAKAHQKSQQSQKEKQKPLTNLDSWDYDSEDEPPSAMKALTLRLYEAQGVPKDKAAAEAAGARAAAQAKSDAAHARRHSSQDKVKKVESKDNLHDDNASNASTTEYEQLDVGGPDGVQPPNSRSKDSSSAETGLLEAMGIMDVTTADEQEEDIKEMEVLAVAEAFGEDFSMPWDGCFEVLVHLQGSRVGVRKKPWRLRATLPPGYPKEVPMLELCGDAPSDLRDAVWDLPESQAKGRKYDCLALLQSGKELLEQHHAADLAAADAARMRGGRTGGGGTNAEDGPVNLERVFFCFTNAPSRSSGGLSAQDVHEICGIVQQYSSVGGVVSQGRPGVLILEGVKHEVDAVLAEIKRYHASFLRRGKPEMVERLVENSTCNTASSSSGASTAASGEKWRAFGEGEFLSLEADGNKQRGKHGSVTKGGLKEELEARGLGNRLNTLLKA